MRTLQWIAVAIVTLPLTATGVPAQGIHIGPGGVGIDAGPRRDQRLVHEFHDDDGCTIRVIRYRRDDGDMVTRSERHC
jgi:hypothetical protein